MTRPLASGRHTAAVSIRSGAGSMNHDRVMRFVPVFDTPQQAVRFAAREALAWIGASRPTAAARADSSGGRAAGAAAELAAADSVQSIAIQESPAWPRKN